MDWVWWIVGFFVVREIAAIVFGWNSPWFGDVWSDAKHNRELYKTGKADRSEVRYTTVGWRRDPFNENDGYTPDPGNERWREGWGYDTASGGKEYYKVIRKGKK